MSINLQGRILAVLGGDEREQEISRAAASAGAAARAYGFPWPQGGIEGVQLCGSADEAMLDADYVLFPIPGIATDGTLFAPDAPAPIRVDGLLLSRMRRGGAIFLGRATPELAAAAADRGVELVEYEDDKELMLLRGPAIVEGVLQLAIANTRVTIHRASVGVVGHGTIGRLLARTLVLLGAEVHVFARNRVQRADALTAGCVPHQLQDLASAATGLAMLFSTVPAPVVGADVLAQLPPGSLVVDLAAPPGGVDLATARALGHRAIWARGLGRRAPVTVGRSQWSGIERRIAEIEARRRDEG